MLLPQFLGRQQLPESHFLKLAREIAPWRRKRQPTPVLLPRTSHAKRSLAGYSSWSRKRVRHDRVTEDREIKQRMYIPKSSWGYIVLQIFFYDSLKILD